MWPARRQYQPLTIAEIAELLGDQAEYLLDFQHPKIAKEHLYLPSKDFIKEVWEESDRNNDVLRNLKLLFNHGRLAGTGYLSILPVDQGVEHAAGYSFYKNPIYFDPAKIVELAIEGGCNAVASSAGVLGAVAHRYAEKIPFVVKLNHNELLSYPNQHRQTMFATVDQAATMGAVAVGATIYFGSKDSRAEIEEVSQAFAQAHQQGLATILWAYVRNPAFKVAGRNQERAVDITGQANYLAATVGADIIKQKLPESNNGYQVLNMGESSYGKYDPSVSRELIGQHPIDWARYQILNNYAGRLGLLNSGGKSSDDDLVEVVRTAVINKRAGGMGVIAGRKAFQRPFEEGVYLLHAIQDVYLNEEVTIA